MAYIGVSPTNGVRKRFTYAATAGQTSFSAAAESGGTLTYKDSLYMDVYQNGVLLKPGTDYTATTGTTVVLETGANVNDVVEMVVYDVFSVADTVSSSGGGAFGGAVSMASTLAVTGASTLTGTVTANGDMVLGGTTPTLTIGDAGAEDAKIVFDGNAQDYHIGLDDSADTLVIGKGSALGTTTAMSIDANGIITKPLQPAFLATKSANQDNFAVGSLVAITFDTEVFDQNADFASNTFTAPVTGRYQLSYAIRLLQLDSASGYYYAQLTTSNRNYINIFDPDFGQDAGHWTLNFSILADMDASDTASVGIIMQNGAVQTDVNGNTFFSGVLAC